MGAKTNDPAPEAAFGKRVKESREVEQKEDEEGEERVMREMGNFLLAFGGGV